MRHVKNILLVDDDQWLTGCLDNLLQKEGFTVHVAANGRAALQWLEKESADLIITDIFMDDMDGIDMVRMVKKSFPNVKIIAMSGGSSVVQMDCLSMVKTLGADRVLDKPVDYSSLMALVCEMDAELGG